MSVQAETTGAKQTGDVKIVGPDEGDSFWQPVPANGFVRNIFNGRDLGARNDFSVSTQTVAPHSFIREHTHADHEEVIYVIEGKGVARVDGVEHPLAVGSSVYIGCNRLHHFLNPNPTPMTFVVILLPGGLDKFFAEIGRPKHKGDPAPEPFARPGNIAEIEARTVFGWVDASFNQKK